jgi:hypothetical protein
MGMDTAVLEDLMARSQWVIRATVEAAQATTLRAAAASENTFAVRVDEIMHGPPALADQRGRTITLYSHTPRGLEKGTRAVFFTRSWLYGESVAVVEVGRAEESEVAEVRRDLEAAQQVIADRHLHERIGRAELVIAGKVLRTQRAVRGDQRRPTTEHDPDWWMAEVEVESVEKGRALERIVHVLFARSRDEMWIDSPKFATGQVGVWILQRDQTEKGWPVLRIPGLSALDPLDFQPPHELERVRRLMAR